MSQSIDCGEGRVYNPLTGRCIKTTGVTAKRLGPGLSQVGSCDGSVYQTPSGISYCTKTKTLVERSKRSSASQISRVSNGNNVIITGSTPVRVDTRIAQALRNVRRTLQQKNQTIRQLRTKMASLSTGSKASRAKIQRQLDQCEKRVNALIGKINV